MDTYSQWKGWDPVLFGNYNRRDGRYYGWHVKRACGERPGLTVLEIGFGNGAFMGWLKAAGHTVVGVESNPALVSSANAKGFQAFPTIESLPQDARFDLIAAFDVAEHIEPAALPGFLAKLRAHCLPEGTLMLRFPNGDSPFGLLHQNGDLTHCNAIGRSKLMQAASMSGWRLHQIGDAPWWADQVAPRNLRTVLRRATRQMLERLICFAYYNERLDLSPNMVALLKVASSARSGSNRP